MHNELSETHTQMPDISRLREVGRRLAAEHGLSPTAEKEIVKFWGYGPIVLAMVQVDHPLRCSSCKKAIEPLAALESALCDTSDEYLKRVKSGESPEEAMSFAFKNVLQRHDVEPTVAGLRLAIGENYPRYEAALQHTIEPSSVSIPSPLRTISRVGELLPSGVRNTVFLAEFGELEARAIKSLENCRSSWERRVVVYMLRLRVVSLFAECAASWMLSSVAVRIIALALGFERAIEWLVRR
jgi:hypothetical protein